MKKFALLGLALLAAVVTPLLAVDAASEKTLTGEPVDIACYLGGKSGPGHASCAATCANNGKPIGLVVMEDGKKQLYLVLGGGGKAAKDLLASHMGKQVMATGDVVSKEGLHLITVSKVEEKKAG